jgi:hypothetical protein
MDALNVYRDKLERAIEKYPAVDKVLVDLEKKTNVKKVYIAYGGYTLSCRRTLFFAATCRRVMLLSPCACFAFACHSKTFALAPFLYLDPTVACPIF